jgi:hypothetical protein
MNMKTTIGDDYFQSDLSWLEQGVEILESAPDPSISTRAVARTVENIVMGVVEIEHIDFVIGNNIQFGKIRYKFSEDYCRRNTLRQLGHAVSAETRKKISLALTGRKSTPEANAKRSAKSKLHRHTEEAKLKISAGNKGKTVSAETRAKISANNQARKAAGYVPRPLTDEQRAKISAAHKGKLVSEETRAKLRAHNLGKKKGIPKSPETIARMKEAAKRRWAMTTDRTRVRNPESTAKMIATKQARKQKKQETMSV